MLCISIWPSNKRILYNHLNRYDDKKKISERAITKYKVLDKNTNATLVLLNPITGRKHQIRKQLFSIGFPVIGDSKYNFSKNKIDKNNQFFLHAYSIKFMINEKKYEYTVDVPEDFKKMLSNTFNSQNIFKAPAHGLYLKKVYYD